VASVAADTSAIAPTPPLPSRSDATAPAGPAGAFSGLLDAAAAPATLPPPQGAAGARTDDRSSLAQAGASGTSPAGADAAAASPRNGKVAGGGKSSGDQSADDSSADPASTAVTLSVVAGLALPAFAFPPLPPANQTSALSQSTPTASSDSAAPTPDNTTGPPRDRKDAGASSDPMPPVPAAALLGFVAVVAVAAPDSSPPAPTASLASSPPGAAITAAILPTPGPMPGPISPPAPTLPAGTSTAPSTGAPAAGSNEAKVAAPEANVAPPAAPPPDATGQQIQPTSTPALDPLTTAAFPTSAPPATDGRPAAALPAPAAPAANSPAPDQNAQSMPAAPPIVTSDAPPGPIKPVASVAALNPPAAAVAVPNPPATAAPALNSPPALAALNRPAAAIPALSQPGPPTTPAAEIQLASDSVDTPSPPRDAAAAQIALPAQVALRFAAPIRPADDATSDSGTDVPGGSSIGTTAIAGGNAAPAAAVAPTFTGLLSAMQASPVAVSPQHAAVAPEAVPLAAVPIAIVTRAEAGERKFEIRLDPPDLGRIDVQLNVDSNGRATSHLVVDRADTLDLLRRDAPVLERALQSAGLTTDSGSLQFSLRDQSFAGRNQGMPAPLAPPAPALGAESDVAPLDAAVRRYGAAAGLGGGIDIRV
jgi:flagellar hook-length control protein FliK